MTMAPRYAALTIASKRYIARARVTAASFLQHNPGLPCFLLLADENDGSLDLRDEAFSVINLAALKFSALSAFSFRYTELAFSYALTPYAIDYLLAQGFDGVLFLKQETLILDDLSAVLDNLAKHSVLVTPHFLEPPQRADALAWEINVLRSGVFNGGFIAFSNCVETRQFLAWWQGNTIRNCVLDVENGIHYEQRWLDFVPSFMPGYGVIRDPGINVGHWNLPDRQIRIIDGKVTARGVPCRVFRFSGYDPDVPERVTYHNQTYAVADTGDAAAVFSRYRRMLMEAGYETTRHLAYAYGRYDNGVVISDTAREVYRQLGEDAGRFGNPYQTASAHSYYRWLLERPEGNRP